MSDKLASSPLLGIGELANKVSPRDRLILALDFPTARQSFAFLEDLHQRCARPPLWVKVGLELFLAEGPGLVHTLRSQGYSVFLDLKLHDIPNTVGSAIRALAPLDVDLLTVHAAGGPAMLRVAAEASSSSSPRLRLLAVTVLTSLDADQLAATGVCSTPSEQVSRLAHLARQSGIDGLVASPLEAGTLRDEFGPSLHLVTPGIRLAEAAGTRLKGGDDQQRTATPASALRAGASQLVVGRPITRAVDPVAAYEAVLDEISSGG
jgi:orotidine-5'-phosphate decarboxylase